MEAIVISITEEDVLNYMENMFDICVYEKDLNLTEERLKKIAEHGRDLLDPDIYPTFWKTFSNVMEEAVRVILEKEYLTLVELNDEFLVREYYDEFDEVE